ncbi:diguanylate cyclase [Glaciecola sp. SC05]|uniref:GGDEF domain-containing protein n=1 Tax=Glaciecola sp. SC05 TaxID=1987355 RepID=UPI0035276D15
MHKQVSRRLLPLLVIYFSLAQTTIAQEVLFDNRYEHLYAQLQNNPAEFLNQQRAIEQPIDNTVLLQNHFLRAEAFVLLQDRESAIAELTLGITAMEKFESPNMEAVRASFFERLSDLYSQSGDLINARAAISRSIDNTALPSRQDALVNRLKKRAEIDNLSGASISALQDLQLALQLANTLELKSTAVDIATRMTIIHQQRNEHAIALSYAQRAIDGSQALNDTQALLHILVTSMPSLLSSRQWDSAQTQLTQIVALLENNNQLLYNAKAVQFAGELAYNQGDMFLAIDKLNSALLLFDNQYPLEVAHSHLLLSRAYTELDDMDLAIKHLVEAFNAIPATSTNFDLVQNIHLHRAELLSSLNQFEEAYRVTKDVIAARDINQPIDEIKRMLDMHTNFQLQLQQQENIELKQKNEFQSSEIESKQMLNQLFFVVIALLLAISGLLLLMFVRSRRHRNKLEQIAHTDALTGIYSRRRILEILDFQQDMYNRNLLPYCVAILDLDFFKKINDTYGHQKGDEILKQTAKLAQDSFRKTDSLGRIGGEEFLFIFPDTPLGQGHRLLEKYSEQLLNVAKHANISQATTASIGLVQPEENEAASSIISRADRALYKAKNNGRNQIVSENDNAMDKL